jgi:ComF family protein
MELPIELGQLVRQVGHAVLGVVLPARCLTCDAAVDTPGQLCPVCFVATSFVTDPCCISCGQGFAHEGEGGRTMQCQECLRTPPAWHHARAALRYDAQAGRIILPFKHGGRVETAGALARHMVRAGAALLRDAELLVPVPLHRSRIRARGYNQSALLARAVARLADRAVGLDTLRRIRPTRSLQGQSASSRAAELVGAFTVRSGREAGIAGRRVLLIDDVLTSGATANGCAHALITAGAAQVNLLVAARVPWQIQD